MKKKRHYLTRALKLSLIDDDYSIYDALRAEKYQDCVEAGEPFVLPTLDDINAVDTALLDGGFVVLPDLHLKLLKDLDARELSSFYNIMYSLPPKIFFSSQILNDYRVKRLNATYGRVLSAIREANLAIGEDKNGVLLHFIPKIVLSYLIRSSNISKFRHEFLADAYALARPETHWSWSIKVPATVEAKFAQLSMIRDFELAGLVKKVPLPIHAAEAGVIKLVWADLLGLDDYIRKEEQRAMAAHAEYEANLRHVCRMLGIDAESSDEVIEQAIRDWEVKYKAEYRCDAEYMSEIMDKLQT